ncbi:MAG TPA: hypothetical protein GXX75_08765 [Clostridiales bacterium]|nr:hypothetical protein [Clostridiales bacterium]
MNKNTKRICKDIQQGKQLEAAIPQLFNQLSDQYLAYAKVRLAMHYFSFYEAFCDDGNTWSKTALETLEQLNTIIKEGILQKQSGEAREKWVRSIDGIRRDNTGHVEALTAYTDLFQIYEHVINRVEYRFKGTVEAVDEEELAKEILRYIFDSGDNVIINERIKEMLGQLPVRVTKQKYFELIKGSIDAYLGSDTNSLEAFLYILRTSAMLYPGEELERLYPELWEKKHRLSGIAFKDITEEAYKEALVLLQAATLMLETETTAYIGLQEITNEIYALLLCTPYAGMAGSGTEHAEEAAIRIISEINKQFESKLKSNPSGELLELLTELEGVQESISYELSLLENALYEVKERQKPLTAGLMLEQLLQVLLCSQDLLSSSLFIDFDKQEAPGKIADEDRIYEEKKALIKELSALFERSDRMVTRAVMANTMNKIPVFFVDHKEVMDYVLYSLGRCSDEYEKAACVEIINEIMTE